MWLNGIPHMIFVTAGCLQLANSVDDSRYSGCYSDVKHYSHGNRDSLTNSWAIKECRKQGMTHSVTWHSRKWRCSNLNIAQLQKSTECNSPCQGNNLDICGGINAVGVPLSFSVYRVCDPNKFGMNCDKPCDITNCGEGQECNPVDGKCLGGNQKCRKGWTDWPNCQSNCVAGTYGDDCMKTCSWHCANNATCTFTDGTCPGGECQEGFNGTRCDIEILKATPTSASTNITSTGGLLAILIVVLIIM